MTPKQKEAVRTLLEIKNRAIENRKSMLEWIRSENPSLESDDEAIDYALNHLINAKITVRMAFAMHRED